MKRFEKIGFGWKEMADKNDEAFEKRLQDLVAFKSKLGHCDAPRSYPEILHWDNGAII